MPSELILVIYFIMWYFLVALACLFIISGIDDLFFDAYYWIRYLFRIWKTRHFKPLTYEQLAEKEEQMIAVLIPCWHEAGVIGTMLKHNCYSIDYSKYYFFVGVYPNDPDTVKEVQEVSHLIKQVQCVVGETPGPTNKAANLNGIYKYVREFEKTIDRRFSIFVFHDSEDIIHPMSFKLYNYLIPRKDMIQIPVFPLAVTYWNFTHWLYADEFSENHTKDIIVREAIHGHVPSAGVGTAFSRNALHLLEDPKTQAPFSVNSLTEDYRTSLAIRIHNLKQIFVSQTIIRMKWRPRGLWRKGYVQKPTQEYIATRALFPLEYKKAVRQKARWIIGIVFQEWHHTQWPKNWIIKFTLAHDRKSFITHFINGFGYFVFLFWLIYSLCTYTNPEFPSLQEQLNLHPWVWWLIVTVTLMMIERLLQRMIAIRRIYGWIPSFLSIPRVFYGNLLNLHALMRAYRIYYFTPKNQATNNQPSWDKTEHHFPGSHILTPYRKKIGDLLLEKKLISKEQLDRAILEQQRTGERLGQVLSRFNLISPHELLQVLSKQYNLELISQSIILKTPDKSNLSIPKHMAHWLMNHNAIAVSIDATKNILTVGIEDPTNELLIEKIINHIHPYKARFVLIDFSS
ncbi:bacteriophage N4 adsorption protein B [Legionella pneumophila]|uniref:glycosyl transferase family protein n=1 Tax=Legionella pneumophila TaxID=446 RepID=UPI0007708D11|nr:glycosyl transferase family protein [Legionella pneumophila]HAT9047697.1 phage adsorption protein NrfB [Legionella pneumophila subsp. pneumophila]CZJ92571.1 bacteriophage N4 adsorption protein B [Legionella pneumophila]CZJ95937.1 bacteriophage N4 adsorption protein B [Legionella pneumophila]CZK41034.1 bacteriophage N4 adsorption protein B [Legionella pneumophila]CZK44007.1 bacteriophage N4 adsorption protein B [Legionella pneumophila]